MKWSLKYGATQTKRDQQRYLTQEQELYTKHNTNEIADQQHYNLVPEGDVLPHFLCKIINLVFCVFVVFCLV